MDLEKVREFIQLAKDEGVAELKYETKECKIAINLIGQQAFTLPPHPISESTSSSSMPHNLSRESEDGLHEVTSPFVGTFYAAPAPDKPAYVKVGDKVSTGTTLCILEAMKIMNEIESDVHGEVVEVCVDNESLVEFGQVLFKIRVH